MIDPDKLSASDIRDCLLARGESQDELFRQARDVRARHSGDTVMIRGVLEVSNRCGKNCMYCAMRRTNPDVAHYSMTADRVMELARAVADCGITCLFLQSAQDPKVDEIVEQVIPRAKQELGVDVLLCLGERTRERYARFAELGADSYILKFETSSPELYSKLCCGSHEHRLDCARFIQEAGMKLGSGNIIGLPGQTLDMMVRDVLLGIEMRPDFISSAPFIPNTGTPFENEPKGDVELTLNTMAIWRIVLGHALIPSVSALQRVHPDGQFRGLQAGANVITVNFTPTELRNQYCIYNKDRFIVSLDHARNIIRRAGLQPTLREP